MESHHYPMRIQDEAATADMGTAFMMLPRFSPAFTSSPISPPESDFITPNVSPSTIPMSCFLPSVPGGVGGVGGGEFPGKSSTMEAMRDIIYRMAAMQPIIPIDPEAVRPPKRRNVKISNDPQSVAARQRRERISERIRILQRLVPGGTKMDTASMLDEAVHYVKFLKEEVESLEQAALLYTTNGAGMVVPPPLVSLSYGGDGGGCGHYQSLGRMKMRPPPRA